MDIPSGLKYQLEVPTEAPTFLPVGAQVGAFCWWLNPLANRQLAPWLAPTVGHTNQHLVHVSEAGRSGSDLSASDDATAQKLRHRMNGEFCRVFSRFSRDLQHEKSHLPSVSWSKYLKIFKIFKICNKRGKVQDVALQDLQDSLLQDLCL